MLKHLKVQFGLMAIAAHNLIYNLLPLFRVKNFYLNLTGSKIGKGSCIHTKVRFTWLGRLMIGEDTTVNFNCLIDNRFGVDIGNHVMIGHHCKIYTAGHDIDAPNFAALGGKVTIADYAVIFPNTLIMPNIKIGTGAVVYPGSVVVKDIEPYSVVGGNPAKFIRKRALDDPSYRLNYTYWFINS